MGLAARFALWVSVALALVMMAAGFILYDRSTLLAENKVDRALTLAAQERATEDQFLAKGEVHHQNRSHTASVLEGGVRRTDVEIVNGPNKGKRASAYALPDERGVVVPSEQDPSERDWFALFAFVTGAVILVGAGVASLVAHRVAQPLEGLVNDVRTIARGNLRHRTHVKGTGEVRALARAIDKMGESLAEAQGSEVELGIRLRERQLASQLAQAFLPSDEPWMDGYRVEGAFVPSDEPGGGFYDYCQSGSRSVFLVCDVSGPGIPGALVGATARAYLRSALQSEPDLAVALAMVNKELHRDVERGLFVTALVVVVDPIEHVAQVACAGHKLPLLRFDGADKQLKSLQPNGFALGFDAGQVFERRLEVIHVPFGPGDRLVLAGQGVASVVKENGEEWGEKGLYRTIAKHATSEPGEILEHVLQGAKAFAGRAARPNDYSLVVIARD